MLADWQRLKFFPSSATPYACIEPGTCGMESTCYTTELWPRVTRKSRKYLSAVERKIPCTVLRNRYILFLTWDFHLFQKSNIVQGLRIAHKGFFWSTTWSVNSFCGIIWATFFSQVLVVCQCSRFCYSEDVILNWIFVSIIIKMWSVSVTKHTFQGS